MAKRPTWDELHPYERQQGGYWEYGHGEDEHGNGKVWVPVVNPAAKTMSEQRRQRRDRIAELRLGEAARHFASCRDMGWGAAHPFLGAALDAGPELIAEARRLRAERDHARAELAELHALIGKPSKEWRFDDGHGWFTVARKPLTDEDVQHLRKTTGRPVEHRVVGEWREVGGEDDT